MHMMLHFEGFPIKDGILFNTVEEIWEYIYEHLENFFPELAPKKKDYSLMRIIVGYETNSPVEFTVIDKRERFVEFPKGFTTHIVRPYYIFQAKRKKKTYQQLLDHTV